MNIGRLILLMLEVIVMGAILFVIQLPLRRKQHPVLRSIILVVKILLFPVPTFVYMVMVSWFNKRAARILPPL